MRGAKIYRLVVSGDPGDLPVDVVDEATIQSEGGETTIITSISDQPQLLAVLRRLADVGCYLIELEQLETPPPARGVDGA